MTPDWQFVVHYLVKKIYTVLLIVVEVFSVRGIENVETFLVLLFFRYS